VIERASSADLAFLAMEAGKAPQQFAAILLLEPSGNFSLPRLRQVISERILAIPRLRQRLIKVPVGCGHPVLVDDRDFDIDHHVRSVSCRPPGDERALFDTALSMIMEPLPTKAPLWSVVLITELADGRAAVVVVLHHVLADGLGGLNVLAAIIDPGVGPASVPFSSASPGSADSRSRRFADPAPRNASGGQLLAVPAPGDVRRWRLSARPRRSLLSCATNEFPPQDGSCQAGARSTRSGGASERGHHKRRRSRCCRRRAAPDLAEQR
jgi:Wax ester synthase/diacylglycerol acyltransferase catalytic domain